MTTSVWVCPSGHNAQMNDRFCSECGAPQPASPVPPTSSCVEVALPPLPRTKSPAKIAAITVAVVVGLLLVGWMALGMLANNAEKKFEDVGNQLGMPVASAAVLASPTT